MGEDLHQLRIEAVDDWAPRSADLLARTIEAAIAERGRCLIALSGGSTPRPVFEELATRSLDWDLVVLLQADERVAPAGTEERNLTHQRAVFDGLPVTWLPLPVDPLVTGDQAELEPIAATAIDEFTLQLVELADDPPVIDIAQLGIGRDGHTASLLPGDPALDELRRYVALTGPYRGARRLTLTRPVFDRARLVIWLARGATKREPLGRLLAGDLSIPAGLLRPRRSVIVADADAARQS